MKLRILNARDPRDRETWARFHAKWSTREVFADPTYVSLFARPQDEPLAALAEDDRGAVLYCFLSRPIDASHLAGVSGTARDLTSPYGYGGPFVIGTPSAEEFWTLFDAWARSQDVISEFVRFSLFHDELLPFPGERHPRLVNVVCDLNRDDAAIWADFEHKVRKNVNRARRAGVTIELDPTGQHLDEFLRIYEGTMDRRDAKKGFYFARSFFETIVREMNGQYMFLHALHAGQIVSTELALVSATNVYSFLGGTEAASFDLRPNDLLKLELITWAKRAGRQRFVLGGGYSVDDGIFRYKKAFAPNGLRSYSIGTRVFDAERYAALRTAHVAHARRVDETWVPDPTFFPAYRAELPT